MKFCKQCGKRLTKSKHFCCSSCAASYNNKLRGKMSDAQKEKISIGLHKFYSNKPKHTKICPVCGKTFEVKHLKSGKLSKAKTCSDECHKKLMVENGKKSIEKIKQEGRFQGWKTRNIRSYAELFFEDVLKNNNIEFINEYYLDNKYFLDFYIQTSKLNIDLEIDGKQHKYKNRAIHDKERDTYINSKNIYVYRIPWNEINTKKGSQEMKNKIDEFLKFYKENS